MACNRVSVPPAQVSTCPGKPRNLKWTDCNVGCNASGPVPSDADQHLVFQTPVKQHRVVERKRFYAGAGADDCTAYEMPIPNCTGQIEYTIVGGAGGGSGPVTESSSNYTGAGGGAGYVSHGYLEVEACGGSGKKTLSICVGRGGAGGLVAGGAGQASRVSYSDDLGTVVVLASGGCGGNTPSCGDTRLSALVSPGGKAGARPAGSPAGGAGLDGGDGKESISSDPCPAGGEGGASIVGLPGAGGVSSMGVVLATGGDGTFGGGGGGGGYGICTGSAQSGPAAGGHGGDGYVEISYTRDAPQVFAA
jgi:hypothetical protein